MLMALILFIIPSTMWLLLFNVSNKIPFQRSAMIFIALCCQLYFGIDDLHRGFEILVPKSRRWPGHVALVRNGKL